MAQLQPIAKDSDSVQLHCDIIRIRSLFVVYTLCPAGGSSNNISTPATIIFVFLFTPHTSENHAFVDNLDFLSVHFPNRQTIRDYRLFLSQTNPSIISGHRTFLLMITGFPTKPSTMKHCCAMWTAESSYATLSTHPLPLTRWIYSSFLPTMKPNTASRCNVTLTCPTSNPKYVAVSTILSRNTGLCLTQMESLFL
jgi:hypothetical protein